MMSAANLLIDAYRIRLDQGNKDKIIVLRMSKRLMERVVKLEEFNFAMFHDVLYHEHTRKNGDWNY